MAAIELCVLRVLTAHEFVGWIVDGGATLRVRTTAALPLRLIAEGAPNAAGAAADDNDEGSGSSCYHDLQPPIAWDAARGVLQGEALVEKRGPPPPPSGGDGQSFVDGCGVDSIHSCS